ncbi:zinc-binding alcohol dehydrogenase family protein [Anaerobium acetethylicum]|uniref:L-gulonate 5-dehydrogenase n=1 Tax=Anaerobium acetethylicum TaxID=1619234 RepID=A0A1D3TVT1_9FIRM|nr:zinc-binding alcohol dehydrogenase family protein [Anaerobium acetethylicum]SCP98274.1 L-gulonate 5-dehydrogenase [Anaerobium acetethylicum]
MKVLRVTTPGVIEVQDDEKPVIELNDDVIIKVKTAGICGSDISIYKGTSPVATYPRVIGHEFAGEVVEVGAGVEHLKPGDHVVVNPVCNCGICRICEKGRGNVCANLEVMGVHRDGGFREYVKISSKNVFAINKNIPWNKAAIVEPYTVAAQVTSRGGIEKGDTVLICGSGQIALTILQVCNILGAKCIMTDLVPDRLSRAVEFGAYKTINSGIEDVVSRVKELTDGIGADVSIDAACVGKTLEQAALATRPGGVVVTMGFHDTVAPITEFIITSRELDIRGSRLNNNKFPQVIKWFESGELDPTKIITDEFYFTKIEDAFEKLKTDPENTMKVVLMFDE